VTDKKVETRKPLKKKGVSRKSIRVGENLNQFKMAKIFNKEYGGSCIGRVDGSKIYNKEYGGSCIGRVDGSKIYNKEYGGSCIGRIDGGGQMSAGSAMLLLM